MVVWVEGVDHLTHMIEGVGVNDGVVSDGKSNE